MSAVGRLLRDHRLRTTLLINVASVLEKCDEQILPAGEGAGRGGRALQGWRSAAQLGR